MALQTCRFRGDEGVGPSGALVQDGAVWRQCGALRSTWGKRGLVGERLMAAERAPVEGQLAAPAAQIASGRQQQQHQHQPQQQQLPLLLLAAAAAAALRQ